MSEPVFLKRYKYARVFGNEVQTHQYQWYVIQHIIMQLKGPHYAHFQVNICILSLYCELFQCFNVQKGLYSSHTAPLKNIPIDSGLMTEAVKLIVMF